MLPSHWPDLLQLPRTIARVIAIDYNLLCSWLVAKSLIQVTSYTGQVFLALNIDDHSISHKQVYCYLNNVEGFFFSLLSNSLESNNSPPNYFQWKLIRKVFSRYKTFSGISLGSIHPPIPDKRAKFGIFRNDSFHVSCFPNEIKNKEGSLGVLRHLRSRIYKICISW